MLVPHIARHPARYLGTRAISGEPVTLGRLAGIGKCTLWLDEGGVHFERGGDWGVFLLPRRCLLSAAVRRSGLKRVLDIRWLGAKDEEWISRFSASNGADWTAAVEGLRAATAVWEDEARRSMGGS